MTAKKKITEKKVESEALPIVSIEDIIKILKEQKISKEQHKEILSIALQEVGYIPVQDVIRMGLDGLLYLNERIMSPQEVISFRSHLDSLKDNVAFKIIMDQILFDTIKKGIYYGETVEQIMFAKSTAFLVNELKKYIQNFDN